MIASVELETATLEGLALDWAVADTIGLERPNGPDLDGVWRRWYQPLIDGEPWGDCEPFCPSSDWAHCGPLIDSHQVAIAYHQGPDRSPLATTREAHPAYQTGATVLVAICRAVVASKIGDTVRVPAELVERAQGGGGIS